MTDVTKARKEVHVAVAVIERQGRVLIARRPNHTHQGGLLEFPGGKVEAGETGQQALVREIAEETGLSVPEASLEPVIGIRHDYGDKQVFLDVWRTSEAEGEPEGREGQPIEWLRPEDFRDEEFPAANRPIIRAVRLPRQLAISGSIEANGDSAGKLCRALERKRPDLLVLRAPELDVQRYRKLVGGVLLSCQSAGAGLIVHGAPDRFEGLPGIAGLHLPWRQARVLDARPVPSGVWLGVSCHTAEEVAHAETLGADYVTLGPVLPTPSHPEAPGIGWLAFEEMAQRARVPVYALGGLSASDVPKATERGGQGIAGIRFWCSED
ncbi:Nudix family hydrolase [Marinobacter sp. F4216]|uniref:Nudix family hydrolase n=1 Tax=Marinobacter sp. F4216 TaxID=2874281 RepID=UPI001CBE2151|nr:Nudix family hydrolase [Marinobacter sp. F4216]MBZ2167174.1 Nudix family hydrolase [Marinobacter sp. F4216]